LPKSVDISKHYCDLWKEDEMLSVTKMFSFDAAHHLPEHKGKCKNLHGHTWKVEIEVARKWYDQSLGREGMILDFSDLKELVQNHVLCYVDHQCLNDTGFQLLQNPTAENLSQWILNQMEGAIAEDLKIVRVRVWESNESYAEWREPHEN